MWYAGVSSEQTAWLKPTTTGGRRTASSGNASLIVIFTNWKHWSRWICHSCVICTNKRRQYWGLLISKNVVGPWSHTPTRQCHAPLWGRSDFGFQREIRQNEDEICAPSGVSAHRVPGMVATSGLTYSRTVGLDVAVFAINLTQACGQWYKWTVTSDDRVRSQGRCQVELFKWRKCRVKSLVRPVAVSS